MLLIKKLSYTNIPYIWFFLLILVYPVQVYFSTVFYSYFIYLIAVIYTGYSFFKRQINIIYISTIDKLMIAFIILIIFNLFREFYIYYDIFNLIRILILYIIPILFVYVSIYNKDTFKIKKIYFSIGIAVIIIALELIYEFFYSGISWFEKLNYDYVYKISSLNLEQLLGPLRNNGLMDHIHVTACFISFGIIISMVVYLFNDNKRFSMINLFILILLYSSFLLIGVRLILIYLHIWLALIFILGTKDMRLKIIKVHFIIIIIFSVWCLFTFSFKSYFWSAIYLQYLPKKVLDYFEIYELVTKLAYQNDSIESLKKMENALFISSSNELNYINLLFGTGFGEMNKKEGSLNDDLFFFQLFSSLGLVNSIIFIVISLITLKNMIINLFLNKNIIILFGFFLVILLSITHSGVLIRKQVFPFFFFSIFMIDFYIKILTNKYQK